MNRTKNNLIIVFTGLLAMNGCESGISEPTGSLNGHDYVDLGLPSGTLWATCNFGTNKPENFGDYFSWGGTQPQESYEESNYYYQHKDLNTLPLYADVVASSFGEGWRMPTLEEFSELVNSCKWKWISLGENGGNYGYKVTGPNGNSIFLPAAGCNGVDNGIKGYYWSNTINRDLDECACALEFCSETYYIKDQKEGNTNKRFKGYSVRPVCIIDKKEDDIKNTLGPDAKIVAEVSNSKIKKLYYLNNNDGMNRLMSYNYKTGTSEIISESGLWWMDWKLAGDRLFYTTNSGACGEAGFVSGVSVSYLDTNDDSEHLVTECSDAKFDGNNRVKITKVSATDTRGTYWGDYKYESREYYLDLFASESEYERSRQEQQKIEEEYEQQRNLQGLEWLQGNWRYVSRMYGVTIDTRIGIHENMIVVMHDGEFDYRGSYTIDGNYLVYYYDDGMAVYTPIDRVNRRLMVDDTHAFQRF